MAFEAKNKTFLLAKQKKSYGRTVVFSDLKLQPSNFHQITSNLATIKGAAHTLSDNFTVWE